MKTGYFLGNKQSDLRKKIIHLDKVDTERGLCNRYGLMIFYKEQTDNRSFRLLSLSNENC
jgi:hypothetical protein